MSDSEDNHTKCPRCDHALAAHRDTGCQTLDHRKGSDGKERGVCTCQLSRAQAAELATAQAKILARKARVDEASRAKIKARLKGLRAEIQKHQAEIKKRQAVCAKLESRLGWCRKSEGCMQVDGHAGGCTDMYAY